MKKEYEIALWIAIFVGILLLTVYVIVPFLKGVGTGAKIGGGIGAGAIIGASGTAIAAKVLNGNTPEPTTNAPPLSDPSDNSMLEDNPTLEEQILDLPLEL